MALHRVTWSERYTQEIEVPDGLDDVEKEEWLIEHVDSSEASAEGVEIILVKAL